MWLSSSPIYFSLGVLFSIITVLFDIVFDDFNWSALFLAFTLICFLLLIIFSVILSCFKKSKWIIMGNVILGLDLLFSFFFAFGDASIISSIVCDLVLLVLINTTAYIKRKNEPVTWKKQAWNGKIDKL